MNSTKPAPADSKTAKPVAKRTGRPRIGALPLTAAERSRRVRERKRQAKPAPPVEKQMAGITRASVLADLIAQRQLTSPLHKTIAAKVADAFVADDPTTAAKWLAFLPPMRGEMGTPSVSASGARERVMQMVANAITAHRLELVERASAGDELSERERLLLRLHEIDEQALLSDESEEPAAPKNLDEVAALRAEIVELRRLLAGAQPVEGVADTAVCHFETGELQDGI